ncbi:MAG TPA: hypothetical protein VL866_10190 [Pyrinomonadaceae bacterium]|nr:hypothetical protein [Pyrinomonadaceae bacterium]
MEVHFRRTGERRYAVIINRKDLPIVEKDPAPGFDPLLPHDLMHLVVESELGLTRGIFGQLASGGNAGSFWVQSPEKKSRDATRRRRRNVKRGAKLLRAGREDCAQSERATYICWYEWLSRSRDPQRKTQASKMIGEVKHLWLLSPRSENDALNEEIIGRVCARLDTLSARWSRLGIGENLTVEWPEKN